MDENENPDEAIVDLSEGDSEETTVEEPGHEDAEGNQEDSEASGDGSETPEKTDESVEPDNADEIKKQLDQLKAENEKLKKKHDRVFFENRTLKKAAEKGDKKEDETEFNDAQLLQLIDTHRDDPAVMLQIMKQVSKQQGKSQAVDAVKSQEVRTMRANIDNFLSQNLPQYMEEGSPQYDEMTKSRSLMHLDDHPFGDFLAIASVITSNYPKIIEDIKKSAVDEALKKNGDKVRKQKIKESSPAPSRAETKAGKADDANLAKYLATAKQMNLSKKQTERYLKMVQHSKKPTIVINE